MKKLSNEQSTNQVKGQSLHSWQPASMGEEPSHQLPSFLIPEQDKGTRSPQRSPGAIIKNDPRMDEDFQSWTPVNVLDSGSWRNTSENSAGCHPGQDLQSAFSRVGAGARRTHGPSGELDTESPEMQKIIAQARKKAERIARQQQEERLDSARDEAQKLLNAAEGVLDGMKQQRAELIAQREDQILDLVLEIGQALFGNGLPLTKEALQEVVQDALQEARELGSLVLYLHPDDKDMLDPHWPDSLPGVSGQLKILADPDLQRGGCLVEGECGLVDARVGTKLKKIKSSLLEICQAKNAEQTTEDNR